MQSQTRNNSRRKANKLARAPSVFGLLVLTLATTLAPSHNITIATPIVQTVLSSHLPIFIYGNGDLNQNNGVTSGTGTQSDPYIIENWQIVAGGKNAIQIQYTNKYVTIRNVHLLSGFPGYNGLTLQNSQNVRIENSDFYDSNYDILVTGSQNIQISNNLVHGVGQQSHAASSGIEIDDSSNVTIINNRVSSALMGIRAQNSPDVTIRDNQVSSNFFNNIALYKTSRDHVTNNTVEKVVYAGISAWYSNQLSISNNLVSGESTGTGIDLYWDVNDTIAHNTVYNAEYAIGESDSNTTIYRENNVFDNKYGLSISGSQDDTLQGNTSHSNTRGIVIDSNNIYRKNSNINIQYNIIANNTLGIFLGQGSSIQTSQNNFLNNTEQARDSTSNRNSWNSAYPTGGNYWSDYSGVDHCSGTYQNICNGPDGIGDTPYIVTGAIVDRYPLMTPVTPALYADVSITSAKISLSNPIKGQKLIVTAALTNSGDIVESVTASLYANNAIVSQTVTNIPARQTKNQNITWDTVNTTPGQYRLKIILRIVQYETKLSNNYSTLGLVNVTPDTTPPVWPTNSRLWASEIRLTRIMLHWTPAADDVAIIAYQVYLQNRSLAIVNSTTLSYLVTSLLPGTTYGFTIKAEDAGNNWSTGLDSAFTTFPDTAPPAWPPGTILSVVASTPTSLTLSWSQHATDNVNVTQMRIYQGNSVIATIPGWYDAYTVTGLFVNRTYTFRVEAGDSSNNWSTNGPSVTAATPLPGLLINAVAMVLIQNNTFSPKQLTVQNGDMVAWFSNQQSLTSVFSCSSQWNFSRTRCATMNDPLPAFGSTLSPGEYAAVTFIQPGTYNYFDHFSQATGSIKVLESSSSGGRQPGVSTGDWMKYDSITNGWYSSDGTPAGYPFSTYANAYSVRVNVDRVSHSNVTATSVTSFLNGTDVTISVNGSVLDPSQPLFPWIIAGNAPSFNSTDTRNFAGGLRLVAILNITRHVGIFTASAEYVWDVKTGVLLENTWSVNGSNGVVTNSGFFRVRLTDTNLWAKTQQEFSMTGPAEFTVLSGSSESVQVPLASLNGFYAMVQLSASTLSPSGQVSISFDQDHVLLVPGATSLFQISFNSGQSLGPLKILITASSGQNVHRTVLTVQVTDFGIKVSPADLVLGVGEAGTVVVIVDSPSGDHSSPVILSVSTPPWAPWASSSMISHEKLNGLGVATVTVNPNRSPTNYTLEVRATIGGTLVLSANVNVRIVDFTITPDISAQTSLNPGSSTSATLTIKPVNGFSGIVTLAEATSTNGLTVSITPDHVTGTGQSTVTIQSVKPGNYTITIIATSKQLRHETTLTVSVYPAPSQNIFLSQPSIVYTGIIGGTALAIIGLFLFLKRRTALA